jgi:hypothetical protein
LKHRALPPPRLLAVVAPVSLIGVGAYLAATFSFLAEPRTLTEVAGIVAFLAASTLAERYPVPVEDADANGVSVGFVFAVAALVLFGWAPATFVYATAPTLVALIERRPLIRTVFNAGVFGLVGAVAGALLTLVPGDDTLTVVAQVTMTAATLYAVNMLLVSAAIAASGSARSYVSLLVSNTRWTAVPFALMASAALMLVVLWQRTPILSAALIGPLIAISLYQRSTHRELRAMQLALTDADGARQPPPLPRAPAARADRRGGSENPRLAVPPRRRRLQAHQRPFRPSRRGSRALAGRGQAAAGWRGVSRRR